MRYAHILATGRCVPEQRLTNADVEARLGEPIDAWLIKNVGIRERRIMADDQVTSDLCVIAAREAMERAGITPEQLDLIIVATDTPDNPSPATASVVQHKLGAVNAGTYDLNCACAGWVTAVDVAAKTLAADPHYHHVLVVGGYGMSRYVDWKDKKTCTLFADGAGAVVLGAGDTPGFLGAKLMASGEYHDALGVYTGGTARPSTADAIARTGGRPAVEFVRKFPSTFNTERWPRLLHELVKRADLHMHDVGLFVFTQLNLRTIEATMQVLEQPMEKTHWTMDK